MMMGNGRVVLLLVFSLLVLVSSSSVLGSQFCTKDAGFQHVSPILCPVAKIRMCWNVTDVPGLGPAEKLLVLRVEAKVTGYMSVGFMDKSLIGKADVITFYVDESGDGQAIDGTMSSYTVGSGTHGELLTDSGDNDVMVIGGEERFFNGGSSDGHVDGKYSAVTIRRKFRTDDAEDYKILPGTETGIIWFTSKTAKPTVDGTTGAVTVPTYGYKYPNGNKGTWKVTFEESQSVLSCEYYCSLQQNVSRRCHYFLSLFLCSQSPQPNPTRPLTFSSPSLPLRFVAIRRRRNRSIPVRANAWLGVAHTLQVEHGRLEIFSKIMPRSLLRVESMQHIRLKTLLQRTMP